MQSDPKGVLGDKLLCDAKPLKVFGRARLPPSFQRYGSAGASPSQKNASLESGK